jgi:hypothetical protein
MEPRSSHLPPPPPRPASRAAEPAGRATPPGAEPPAKRRRLGRFHRLQGGRPGIGPAEGRGWVRVGPWRASRRFLPVALVPILVYLALWLLVGYSLGAAGCRGARAAVPLLGARAGAARPPAAEVLVESDRFALPPSAAGNRFAAGWQARQVGGREALVPEPPAARLLAVHLGEETQRTLTLDLLRETLPEGERLSVRTGDRELARATLRAAALPLRVRLPEDLPVGQVPLDLVFGPVLGPPRGDAGGRLARPELPGPGLYGASLSPALPPGSARVEGADLVMGGNCLVYLRCSLTGVEALVGTFVPPEGARRGQRFDLSVERPDGTPVRRFHWLPSFWNRLRGARRFELPLRGTRGPVRVRLLSRAGDAGGPPGRWRALGLVDVTGEILTPGQGQ